MTTKSRRRKNRVAAILNIKRCFCYLIVWSAFLTMFGLIMYGMFQSAKNRENRKSVKTKKLLREVFEGSDNDQQNDVSDLHKELGVKADDSPHTEPTRPEQCKSCFNDEFKYVIDNTEICSTENGRSPEIDVVILITSHHSRKLQREAIRQTWLSDSLKNFGNVRHAFLFGTSEKESENKLIYQENKQYNDVLQENFVESYRNLTLKTIMAYKWFTTKCSKSKFLMKTDDDVFVNVPGLILSLQRKSKQLHTGIGGYCPGMSFPVRDESSKWYVSYKLYPKKVYPKYCSGTGYVTSTNAANNIHRIFKNIPFFPIEDIYMSFCVQKLEYKFITISGFHGNVVSPGCIYRSENFVTSHGLSRDLMYQVWKIKCKNIYSK